MSFSQTRLLLLRNSLRGGFTSEYQAILNRATALGYTLPNTAQKAADNTFIATGKSQGWWALLDWLGVFGYNNVALANFSTLNWKSPLVNPLTSDVSAGTYGLKGWKWDGSTNQGRTAFNPATEGVNYLQDAASLIAYIETIPTIGTAVMGFATGTGSMLRSANVTTQAINSGLNLTGGAVDMTGTGYRAINRSSSSACQLYSDLTKSDRTATSSAPSSDDFRLGRLGTAGTLDRSDTEVGAAAIGGNLSQAQHGQFRAALIARRTAMGL